MREAARLARLERTVESRRLRQACAECGHGEATIARIVVAQAEEAIGPERRPRCGREVVFTIECDHAG